MSPDIVFGQFRLNPAGGRLLRGAHPVSLTPRAYAVLHHLAQRPDQLITKTELLTTLWRDTHVTAEVLKVCVREIRKALGDDARVPRFIETAHRRGYRFIGGRSTSGARALDTGIGNGHRAERPLIVGREAELGRLHALFDDAKHGSRRFVFLTGEPGIGKTATVEEFLRQVSADPDVLVARGQCLELYGSGEAYLPVLDALGRLGRGPAGRRLAQHLRRHAPTWLAHLPALISDEDRQRLERETIGSTTSLMLREIAETVEALTFDTPLILVLEDLHWSDYSTLDLISLLAGRREPARMLLIGTYRDLEIRLNQHPLRAVQQELLSRGLCERVPLGYLTKEAVREYLSERFPEPQRFRQLSHTIHRRTNGNPLFLVNLLGYVASKGLVHTGDGCQAPSELLRREIERGVPDSLRQLIQKQIDRLSREERAVLEAASATSLEFSALAVAAALEEDTGRVEEVCERLTGRGQFLKSAGFRVLPGGALSARFCFIHSLYQNVLHAQTPPSRRLRMHQRIAQRGVSVFGQRAGEIAAELAMHFEQSRDYQEAVLHLVTAASNAGRRRAYREAIDHLTRALSLTRRLPRAERAGRRMEILEQLGGARRSMGDMKGAAANFRSFAARARRHACPVAEARGLFYLASVQSWLDARQSLAAADMAHSISRRIPDPFLQIQIRSYSSYWHLMLRGWTDEGERVCAEAIAAARQAGDTAVLSQHLVRHALYLCLGTRYEEARAAASEGQALAIQANDGFDHLLAQFFLSWAELHAGRWGEAFRTMREGIRMSEKNGHEQWADLFRLMHAWLHLECRNYEEARSLCEPALLRDRSSGFPVGGIMARELLGWICLGREDHAGARRRFDEVARISRRGPVVLGWFWQMRSCLGLAELYLRTDAPGRARQLAQRVLSTASGTGDASCVARARALSARAALAAGAPQEAQAQIDQAFALLQSRQAPLAEWRVAAAAAEVAHARRTAAESDRHRCAAILRRLAGSLDGAEDLRARFLSDSRVRDFVGQTAIIPTSAG